MFTHIAYRYTNFRFMFIYMFCQYLSKIPASSCRGIISSSTTHVIGQSRGDNLMHKHHDTSVSTIIIIARSFCDLFKCNDRFYFYMYES